MMVVTDTHLIQQNHWLSKLLVPINSWSHAAMFFFFNHITNQILPTITDAATVGVQLPNKLGNII